MHYSTEKESKKRRAKLRQGDPDLQIKKKGAGGKAYLSQNTDGGGRGGIRSPLNDCERGKMTVCNMEKREGRSGESILERENEVNSPPLHLWRGPHPQILKGGGGGCPTKKKKSWPRKKR